MAERPGKPVDPELPAPAARAAGAAFGALSRLRGARVVHPVGSAYAGTLRVERAAPGFGSVPLLASPGDHGVVIRFSRGLGLRAPLPDVLGLTLRILDAHGRDRHQDFLLVTSGDRPLMRHLLLPATRFSDKSFSSVLAYRVGGRVAVVGARTPPARGGAEVPARFDLALASLTGRWRAVGDVQVGERLPDAEADALAFTPWNTGGGIRPAGPFMGLRRAAYRGSQRGRGLPPGRVP